MQCSICENQCDIAKGGTGICGMYTNAAGRLVEKYPNHYLVMVPAEIESMPMLHYHPGSKFLQVCTIGCNLRCGGCVSWVLTESTVGFEGALQRAKPEDVVVRAIDQKCRGVMFCFNEPAVSFPTFKRVAAQAREKGLLVGCATNAWFTETAFRDLLEHLDFINIGIKGCTDETYKALGATSVDPVFRNLELSIERGIFTEVAAVYVKGHEDEVMETARRVADLSPDIPFQLMRFLPLGAANHSDEPSVKEAEALCAEIGKVLRYVYLFNSPGTPWLDTCCPECGEVLVRRGFNGPMCAHVTEFVNGGLCRCGRQAAFAGTYEKESGAQVLGYFGGYKTIHSLESIQTVLSFLGERNPSVIAFVLQEILRTNFIEGLYERNKTIGSYLDTVAYYAQLAGRAEKARELREYVERYVSIIRNAAKTVKERPAVYFALGHPLIAVFGDKFECNLVEIAGGRCVNKAIDRDDTPGMTIAADTLKRLDPDVMLVSGAIGYPVADCYAFFEANGLNDLKAVRDRKVYSLSPYNTGGRPDWILGLMQIANLLHPEIFGFDMPTVANGFYERFLGVPLAAVTNSRSIAHPKVLGREKTNLDREERCAPLDANIMRGTVSHDFNDSK